MAPLFNILHRLLLTTLIITTTSLRLISASDTPPPSEAPQLLPPSPPITVPPPPPPLSPPPPPTLAITQENQLNNIIDALIGAGDFMGWANLLYSADPSSLPLTATFFIPSNDALSHLPTATAAGINFNPFLIPYHIVPQRLIFSDLQQFSTGTRLPTLLPPKYIVITNNSTSNFTIDDSQITNPDIFVNTGFAVHGVKNILDYSVYGGGGGILPAPPTKTTSPSVESTPVLPKEKKPVFPGGIAAGGEFPLSSASCLYGGFVTIFSVGTAFIAYKILQSG